MVTSGAFTTGVFTLFNGHLQRRFTARLEDSKTANAAQLKAIDAAVAEADRKSALALRRDDSRMTTLLQVNRLAADAETFAYNVTIESLGDGTPLYSPRPYANSGKSPEEAQRDAARLESDSYFFSPDLGRAVTHLRECEESLRWDAQENRTPVEHFEDSDPLVINLRAAVATVRAQVQAMLSNWST